MANATRTGKLLVGTGGFGLGVLASSVVALFLGTINVQRAVNFVPNGNTTGAVISVKGTTVSQIFIVPCTATGGNKRSGQATADTCITSSPLSTTGAIDFVEFHSKRTPVAFGFDLGFVKAANTGTGTGLRNLTDVTSGTGLIFRFSTGSIRWNPADKLKLGTLTNPTASFSGYLVIGLHEDLSE